MGVRFQVVIDCAEPEPLARFWAAALGYVLEPPPEGFAVWDDYYRHIGLPEHFLGHGTDHIIDPTGSGPRFWFQKVPEVKTIKNRLHLDVNASGGLPAKTSSRFGLRTSAPKVSQMANLYWKGLEAGEHQSTFSARHALTAHFSRPETNHCEFQSQEQAHRRW